MDLTIDVDLSKVTARFSQAGIPESVRNNLRRMFPVLASNMTAAINNRMNTQLNTRRTLTVKRLMREDARQITLELSLVSPSAGGLLPTYLELGTRPHSIVAKNVSMLHFTLGGVIEVYTRRVNHPGTRPYKFMSDTLAEFMPDIRDMIQKATQGLD